MRSQALRQPPRGGEELELRGKLDALKRELDDPSQYKGKLHELRARIGMQVAHHIHPIDVLTALRWQDGGDAYRLAQPMLAPGEAVLSQIADHLEAQQRGLDHLLKLMEKDLQQLHVVEAGYGLPPAT